jgi:hypothetical protein
MSCNEELEGVISSLGPHLRNCTMALYNGSGFTSADILALLTEGGASGRVFTVSSVSQGIGKFRKC